MRQRQIRKIGNSYFICLLNADVKDYGLTKNDKVDIEDLGMLEQSKNKSSPKRIKQSARTNQNK